MSDSGFVEFEMPLQMQGKLSGDPQFEGMTRKFRIGREAMEKAIGIASLRLTAQELYDEFFFDIWMRVRDDVWARRPDGGYVEITPSDITDDGDRLV